MSRYTCMWGSISPAPPHHSQAAFTESDKTKLRPLCLNDKPLTKWYISQPEHHSACPLSRSASLKLFGSSCLGPQDLKWQVCTTMPCLCNHLNYEKQHKENEWSRKLYIRDMMRHDHTSSYTEVGLESCASNTDQWSPLQAQGSFQGIYLPIIDFYYANSLYLSKINQIS